MTSPHPISYVLCPSYSGATLLACFLNCHPDVSSLGDMNLSRRFVSENRLCGCGLPVRDCSFWNNLIGGVDPDRKFQGGSLLPNFADFVGRPRLNRLINRALAYGCLVLGPKALLPFMRSLQPFREAYFRFYEMSNRLLRTSVFVDGEKSLTKTLLTLGAEDSRENIRVLHLSRDPRGTYFSMVRHNRGVDIEDFCRDWRRYHTRVSRLRKWVSYSHIRYEDLCLATDATLETVFAFLGVQFIPVKTSVSDLRKKHIIGNTMIHRFDGQIEYDRRWEKELDDETKSTVLEKTMPISGLLGYTS